jgi:hypothetical protein
LGYLRLGWWAAGCLPQLAVTQQLVFAGCWPDQGPSARGVVWCGVGAVAGFTSTTWLRPPQVCVQRLARQGGGWTCHCGTACAALSSGYATTPPRSRKQQHPQCAGRGLESLLTVCPGEWPLIWWWSAGRDTSTGASDLQREVASILCAWLCVCVLLAGAVWLPPPCATSRVAMWLQRWSLWPLGGGRPVGGGWSCGGRPSCRAFGLHVAQVRVHGYSQCLRGPLITAVRQCASQASCTPLLPPVGLQGVTSAPGHVRVCTCSHVCVPMGWGPAAAGWLLGPVLRCARRWMSQERRSSAGARLCSSSSSQRSSRHAALLGAGWLQGANVGAGVWLLL